MNQKQTQNSLFLLFAFSGISGIIYEIIWVRWFGLIFGNTVFASSTVLAVFMTGLALGSFYFGKYVDNNKKALPLYFKLEIAIGLAGLLVPLAIWAATPLYSFIFTHSNLSFYQISAIRLIVSFIILIIPCTLIGATLPVLCRLYTDTFGGKAENRISLLYAINTLGAVLGCLIAGYFLIGTVGLIGTTLVAACINLSIAIVVLSLRQNITIFQKANLKETPAQNQIHTEEYMLSKWSRFQRNIVLAAYTISGFSSLFLEVAWTKAIVWVIGMDAYAFASMLAVFLFGLCLGSFILSRFITNMKNPILRLGIITSLIGFSVLLSTVLIINMYGLMSVFKAALPTTTYLGGFAFLLGIAAAIMAIPATLMGMAFPLALKIFLNNSNKVGASVGTIYFANTTGSVLGSLSAGFIALPLLGVMKSIVFAGSIFLIVAALLVATAWEFKNKVANVATAMFSLASITIMILYAPNFQNALAKGFGPDESLLYFKETITGDVEVTQSTIEGLSMKIDGVHVASDGQTDLPSHIYPAHLMSLLKSHPQTALFIAFGAGGTAGSILKYNDLKRLDVVEICGGVVEPARSYFTSMNNNVLCDTRLHLIIQDGKNYVRLTDSTYDMIYSGPIHPQSNQGSAALYTKDFFQDCRNRLKKGGLQCVWLPLHMPLEDYKIIVKTFQTVYTHSSLWLTSGSPNTIGHTHLIGSLEPLTIDYDLITSKLKNPSITSDINRLNYVPLASAFDLLCQLSMSEDSLKKFTADIKKLNTDNLPVAEFFRKPGRKSFAPQEYPPILLKEILRYKEMSFPRSITVTGSIPQLFENDLADYYTGDNERILGHISYMQAYNHMNTNSKIDRTSEAVQHYADAFRHYTNAQQYLPEDRFIKDYFVEAKAMAGN